MIRDVVQVVRSSYCVALLSTVLPWPYYHLYVDRFCREELLKNRNVYSEG